MRRYAVNIADMTVPANRMVAAILVGPVRGEVVEVKAERFDGVAVVLDCDEERAEAIVGVIRLKARRSQWRCYTSTTGKSWIRV